MIAKSGNTHHVAGRDGAVVVDVYASGVSSGDLVDEGGDYPSESGRSDVVADPRWDAKVYIERFGDSMDCWRFKAMTVDGSSPFIYDCHRVKLDNCVGAGRRRRRLFNRNRSI